MTTRLAGFAGRVGSVSVFTLLAVLQADAARGTVQSSARVFHALTACLWLLFAWAALRRATPVKRGPVLGAAVGFASIPAAVALSLAGSDAAAAPWRIATADVLLAVGLSWALVSAAWLGRCFGVFPDARGLVTTGPYAVVRHPLYLGELTGMAGVVLCSTRSVVALGAFAVLVAIDLARTVYEEQTLRSAFPDYDDYARRVRFRIVPGAL